MPSRESHIATAVDNFELAKVLLPTSLAWCTTVSFYAALHIVDAVLALENIHPENHHARTGHLKTKRNLQHIWKHYKPLYDHSRRARYLMGGDSSAEALIQASLGRENVERQVINHFLKQVDASACRLLSMEKILTDWP
ncbi:MAG: hypothetical protein KDA77_12010 [Planctomycetaceae bacterium]|nr:hypothetical protein [Planctomycetaceae bacterium]